MRSPGWMADIETCVVDEYWAPEKCGKLTPPALQAHAVRPEQSKAFGPTAPQTYGLPSCRCASAMAAPAPPFEAGAGPEGADGAEGGGGAAAGAGAEPAATRRAGAAAAAGAGAADCAWACAWACACAC